MEYDYSPEVHQRYLESQARIARWCDTTETHSQEHKAPFRAGSDVDANEQWDGVTRVTRGETSRSSGIAAPRRLAPAAKLHKLSKPHKSHKSTPPPSYIPPQYAKFQHTQSRTYTTSVRTSDTSSLDLFRKPRSKLPTPTSLLRTTSDATTKSAFQSQLRSPVYTSGFRSRTPPSLPTSRVVVREKMSDLASVAKQEIKACDVRQDSVQKGHEDVIDPTGSVDLPPPLSTCPVQTPALHGLGVDESVGAVLLADRLPFPSSPGSSSTNHDDNWRKDLLKAAVSYPFESSNSPVTSPVQSSPSSGNMSTIMTESRSDARIISHPIIDNHSSSLSKSPSTSSHDPLVPRFSRPHDSEYMDSEEGSHLPRTVVSKRECKPRDMPEDISHIPSSQDPLREPHVDRYHRSQPSDKIVDGTYDEVENPKRIPCTWLERISRALPFWRFTISSEESQPRGSGWLGGYPDSEVIWTSQLVRQFDLDWKIIPSRRHPPIKELPEVYHPESPFKNYVYGLQFGDSRFLDTRRKRSIHLTVFVHRHLGGHTSYTITINNSVVIMRDQHGTTNTGDHNRTDNGDRYSDSGVYTSLCSRTLELSTWNNLGPNDPTQWGTSTVGSKTLSTQPQKRPVLDFATFATLIIIITAVSVALIRPDLTRGQLVPPEPPPRVHFISTFRAAVHHVVLDASESPILAFFLSQLIDVSILLIIIATLLTVIIILLKYIKFCLRELFGVLQWASD
ncbi:hypothetical protein VNI00_006330 [Paramarasmius palmivorus]|uniref:Uncharacterized protein n=1 Tax=Paramarasmius palmivorus TaxID=297713 RepID=A0AAW0D9H1_9AGAR